MKENPALVLLKDEFGNSWPERVSGGSNLMVLSFVLFARRGYRHYHLNTPCHPSVTERYLFQGQAVLADGDALLSHVLCAIP